MRYDSLVTNTPVTHGLTFFSNIKLWVKLISSGLLQVLNGKQSPDTIMFIFVSHLHNSFIYSPFFKAGLLLQHTCSQIYLELSTLSLDFGRMVNKWLTLMLHSKKVPGSIPGLSLVCIFSQPILVFL